MMKNLHSIDIVNGRMLYRVEGDGYCFYSTQSMKFYFLDKVTSIFLLERFGEITQEAVLKSLGDILEYDVSGVYDELKKHYLESIPEELSLFGSTNHLE
jgi:hypothetical protein